jgi:protein gp37
MNIVGAQINSAESGAGTVLVAGAVAGPLPGLNMTEVDWVIAGGESGPGFRPLDLDWVRDLRDRCRALDLAVVDSGRTTRWRRGRLGRVV